MAIYLDYNASAPVLPEVLDVMISAYKNTIGNADSRTHQFGTDAQKEVQRCRSIISKVIAIDPNDLLFTSGATESNNMSILGMVDYAEKTGKNHFITTAMEHKAILEPLKHLEAKGFKVDYVKPDITGRIKVDDILNLVSEKTCLVSVMYVNSETGVIQPVKELGEKLKDKDVYFHIDATQAIGKLNEDIRSTYYDLMTFTAHKIGGPQGIGALVIKRNKNYQRTPITPLMYGGPQERGYRPGTTSIALITGFAKAIELCELNYNSTHTKCMAIKNKLLNALQNVKYTINGDPNYTIPSTINISIDGLDAEAAFLCLGEDYAFSNGSACNSAGHSLSYVLEAMGLDEKRKSEAIRLSWDGSQDIDFEPFVDVIKNII